MPLTDLVHALPGLLLVGLLPGLALGTLVAPRWPWWQRLGAAPALSAGVAAVIGLGFHDTGVPFRPGTVLPCTAALAAGAWVRRHRSRGLPRLGPEAGRSIVLGVTGVALLAGLAAGIVLAAGLRDTPLPPGGDSAIHATMAEAIASTGDILPVIPEPADHSGWVRVRAGLEGEAALVSQLGGVSPSGSLLPLVLLAVMLFPLGVAALAWEVSRRPAVAAAAAALALLTAFPAWPISFGELPLVVDSTLIAPLILAALRGLRDDGLTDAVAMVAAAAATNAVVHGTELFTAALIGGPIVIAAVWTARGRPVFLRAALIAAAAVLATAAAAIVTAAPAVPASTPDAAGGATISEVGDFGLLVGHRSVRTALDELTGFQPAWQLLALLVVIGAAVAFRRRQMRALLVAEIGVLLCYFDSVSVGALRPLWTHLYPWSTDDRLMQIQLFALAPLAALGAVAVGEWLARRRRSFEWLVMPAVVAAGAAGLGLTHARAIYADALANRPGITVTDVIALRAMSERLPATAVVMSDDTDAGIWISALTPQRLFMPWPYLRSHPDDTRVAALGRACRSPWVANASLFAGIDAIFVGARQSDGVASWTASCIERLPWLHVVIRQSGIDGTALVLAVDRGQPMRSGG